MQMRGQFRCAARSVYGLRGIVVGCGQMCRMLVENEGCRSFEA